MDTTLLRIFITDRGKIRARRITGNRTQHQRDIATAVKMPLLQPSTLDGGRAEIGHPPFDNGSNSG